MPLVRTGKHKVDNGFLAWNGPVETLIGYEKFEDAVDDDFVCEFFPGKPCPGFSILAVG